MIKTDWSKHLYKIIGYRITKKRHEKKLTQEELSKKIGLSRTSVVLIEQGKQKLPIDRVYKFAETLEVDPYFFFPDVSEILPKKVPDEDTLTYKEKQLIEEILEKYKFVKKSINNLLKINV